MATTAVCKHERTQGTLSGWSADKSRHCETVMVAQQPELTRVVGVMIMMHVDLHNRSTYVT